MSKTSSTQPKIQKSKASKIMSTPTETNTATVGVTVTATIEAPKAVVEAIKSSVKADSNSRKNALQLARVVRSYGIDAAKKGLKEGEIRKTLAASIANARGLKIEDVLTPPRKDNSGGDQNAYNQLSQLFKIAKPVEGQEDAVDAELAKADEETTYTEVLNASRKPRAPRTQGDGTAKGKGKDNAPLTPDAFSAQYATLAGAALAAEIPVADLEAIIKKIHSHVFAGQKA